MGLTEGEAEHRRKIELKAFEAERESLLRAHRERTTGQWIGAGLLLTLTAARTWLSLAGQTAVGAVIFGTTILSIPAIAYANKRARKAEEPD